MNKMTAAVASLPLVGFVLVVSAMGCKNNDAQDPSTIQNNSGGYQSGGYQTGGYTNPSGGYTNPQPVQTATNPLQIIPCSSDAQCLTARCNLSIGKCSSPCASSMDCQTGNGCVAGACVPGAP